MKLALLEALLAARRAGGSAGLLTDLATGAQYLLTGDPDERAAALAALSLTPAERDQVEQSILDDRSRAIERGGGGAVFVEIWHPPARLLVVGGVHIAQALIPMAAMLGYAVLLIDPRGRFGSVARFPGVEITNDWPDAALARVAPDKRTAVVTLAHDPKIDDPALMAALGTEAFYIGALGSRRSHAGRVARLREAGFADRAIERVRGPVGLAIGAITPAEIALSVLAEMTAVLRGREAPAVRA